ncbi:MAG: type II and III secretion system protein family protein [Novosphingobium sp.]
MNRRFVKTFFTAACALTPLALVPAAPAQAQSVMRPANDITLSIGRGQLVTVAGSMADVFVANDSVADVQVKSSRQLYVFGKAGGETTIYASNASGDVIWSANIRVGSNIDSIDQMLNLAMPDAKINVSTMGTNTFLLTGTIGSPEDAAEAQRLVTAFVGGGSSSAQAPNVISRLRMATPLQVNLQVRIAEVSRSFIRSLGVNLATVDQTSGFKFGLGQGREGFSTSFIPGAPLGVGLTNDNASAIKTNQLGATLGFAGKFLGLDLLGALDAAETVGLVSTLAQPNLTALSGETADFLAGGEYPIPLAQGLGTTTIEYKKYGVSLAYTPTVLSNGRISLRVRPEVSELSSDGAVTLNGYSVPALTIRRAETTVELGSGQAFMIAGLMSNRSVNAIDKMPGAGDLPILGSLFRSTQYRKGETELVIVVTPYLVNPVNDRDIVLPTDGFRAPDELQRLLGNMESDGISGGKRAMPTTAPAATTDPSVGGGALPPVGIAPQQPDDRTSRSNRKSADAASTPAPGFNLD